MIGVCVACKYSGGDLREQKGEVQEIQTGKEEK